MEQFAEGESTREEIKNKLRQNFDGKIVRKDLTKKIKEGANVPVYVLEFLLGQYCSSDDETVIEKGVQNVKRILADNFVRPDESQKILSQLRKKGSHTIIDMVTVRLDMKKDCFLQSFLIWALVMYRLPTNIRKNLIACSVAVSGVLFSWIIRLKATIILALRTLMEIHFVPNRKSRKIFHQSVSVS